MDTGLGRTRALVTGAASGLGLAVAERIVADGGRVALLDLDRERGEAAARRLGSSALFLACDVGATHSVDKAIAAALGRLEWLDLAVNCAGIAAPGRVVGRDHLLSVEVFKRVIEVNLLGTFLISRGVAAAMQTNTPRGADGEHGVIVCTASIAAFEGQIGQVPYAASKAGVVGMILPMAREFASFGVRVMAVAPGPFATPLLDQLPETERRGLQSEFVFPPRPGQAAEFAEMVAQIYANPLLNGSVVRLDGALRLTPKSRSVGTLEGR